MRHNSRYYLDNNATSPLKEEVFKKIYPLFLLKGNASSVHQEGREIRKILDSARQSLAEFIGTDSAGVVFTSGGTEACNMAMGVKKAPAGEIKRIIVSGIEHSSVLRAAERQGVPVTILRVTSDGLVDLEHLDELLSEATPALVGIMAANNETGAVQPIVEVGQKIRNHGSVFFCDAVQAIGKMPISLSEMNIDICALSAHKIGGLSGVGALVCAPHIVIEPLLCGGGQEFNRRAGTENVIGIGSLGFAVESAKKNIAHIKQQQKWRDDMEKVLQAEVEDVHIFSKNVLRLGNTSYFSIKGVHAETLMMALDIAGFAVSAGSACSSGKIKKSHVLQAMNVPDSLNSAAIRVSFGAENLAKDGIKLAQEWIRFVKQKRSSI